MRRRAMSLFLPREDLCRKFEAVSDEVSSDSDDDKEDVEESRNWSMQEFQTLVTQIKDRLPKKDVRWWKTTLQAVDWSQIKVGQRPAMEVELVAKDVLGKTRKTRSLTEMLGDVPDVAARLICVGIPKPPRSAYMLFAKEKWAQLREERKDLKVTQLPKIIGDLWGVMAAKEKRRYEKEFALKKEEYRTAVDKCCDENPELSTKKHYILGKQPRMTPCHLFYLDRKQISTNITSQQARKEWELLPVKHKVPFIRRSFEAQGTTDSKLVNKKEQDMLEKNLGKPEFCGRNVYDYYRKKIKTTPGKVRPNYKDLSEQELEALNLEYQQARSTFVDKYRKYIEKLPKEMQQAELDALKSMSEKLSKKHKSRKANVVVEDDSYLDDPPAAKSTAITETPPTKTRKVVAPTNKPHKSDHFSKTMLIANSVTTSTKQKQPSSSATGTEEPALPKPRPKVAAAVSSASSTKNGKKRTSDEEVLRVVAAKKTKKIGTPFPKTILAKKSMNGKSKKANPVVDQDSTLENLATAESKPFSKTPPTKPRKVAANKNTISDHFSKTAEVAASVATPTKRKSSSVTVTKQSTSSDEEDERAPQKRIKLSPSASSTKKGKKRISDQESQPAVADKKTKVKQEDDQAASVKATPKEPEKPPRAVEEFYRQQIYLGKVGRHTESYANLSSAKKLHIMEQHKAAQKQYLVDFAIFLKTLPIEDVLERARAAALKKRNKSEDTDDDDDEDDEEEKD